MSQTLCSTISKKTIYIAKNKIGIQPLICQKQKNQQQFSQNT
jgi:hypothetical protein